MCLQGSPLKWPSFASIVAAKPKPGPGLRDFDATVGWLPLAAREDWQRHRRDTNQNSDTTAPNMDWDTHRNTTET